MRRGMLGLVLGMLMLWAVPVFAGENSEELFARLAKIYQENLAGMQVKDLGRVIATFHPESPSFANAKAAAAQSMISFDLSYKLVGVEFVGLSREYAVIRVIQETRRVGGDDKFQDNTLDVLQIFKQDKAGEWKLWASSVLGATPLK